MSDCMGDNAHMNVDAAIPYAHDHEMLRVGRFVRRTESEGPGMRAALWLQGCSIRCARCCNPELFAATGGVEIHVDELAAEVAALDVEGVTLLGGEPLDQPRATRRFLEMLREREHPNGGRHGVMLFTGYDFDLARTDSERRAVLELCDLVVAGPYIEELAPDPRRWIGSRNQTTHVLSPRYGDLEKRWDQDRFEIEVHIRDDEIVINGTPWGSHFEFLERS